MFPRIKPAVSIRFLLALILLIGMALGVVIVPYREYRRQDALALNLVHFKTNINVSVLYYGGPMVETRPCWQASLIGDRSTGAVTALRFYESADGERIARLAEFGELETLCFYSGMEATGPGLTQLARLPSLRSLELAGPGVQDADLALLKNFPRLESLTLTCDDFTDVGLDHLGELPRLHDLHLSFNERTRSTAYPLVRLKGLRSLTLETEFLEDADLDYLWKLPELERLVLINLPITDYGIDLLTGLHRLESLKIQGSKIEGRGLVAIERMPGLRELELSFVDGLTDEGLEPLRRATQLRALRLSCNEQIGDASLERLKSLTHLQELYIWNCNSRAFSEETVAELRKALPKTRVVVQ